MPTFDCLARLRQAAGRALSDAEVQDVFERIHQAALDIKAGRATAPAPKSGINPSVDSLMAQVAQDAARQYIADAALKAQRAQQQVVAIAARQAETRGMVAAGISPVKSIERLIAIDADGRTNNFSLEARVEGVTDDLKRGLQDTWLALGRNWLGFVQDAEKIRLLLREMKGEKTGDADAAKGAKAWRDMAEAARQRFNAAGGEIGKLDDWALPQHHSQERVLRAGKQAWVDGVLPLLDRSRYVDDAGVAWPEPRLKEFLAKAYDSIATNGFANVEPGKNRGMGARANRGKEQRQIHFKDADSYLGYWASFGEKTFPDILMGHMDTMGRDIGLLEHFGPNPEAAYRTLRDMAGVEQSQAFASAATEKERARGPAGINKDLASLQSIWNVASGNTLPVADQRIAAVFSLMRNLNVAGKLGSAVWSSVFGDKVMLETVSHLNNVPAIQRWRNEMAILDPTNAADRRMLQRQGLMLEYMSNAMQRFGDEYGKSSWSGKLAGAVMRASGMNAINTWRRGAFGLDLMSTLGEMMGHDFKAATAEDMHLLKSYGINDRDWRIWQLAQLRDLGHGNASSLTPDGIAGITDAQLHGAGIIAAGESGAATRQEAITKLLGAINSESKYAIVEPGWRQRAQLFANQQPGTWKGEITRAFWQFKSFPIAQFEKMWEIAMSRPTTGGKAGVLAAVIGMTTLAGAMTMQVQDMLAGKDPRDAADWKFWLAAFIKGGSLGLYGDFLYNTTQTRYGTGPIEAMAGPTIGTALDTLTAAMQAAKAKTEGRDSHLLAHYLQSAKGFIPFNNLWYTKAATDHLIFQNLQEYLSPGYLSNMQARSLHDFQQKWWWSPGASAPERAPDLQRAVGQ